MKHSTLFLSVAVVLSIGKATAQSSAELGINDVRARFWSHGLTGCDPSSSTPMFQVPQDGDAHALFAAGLWMGGLSPDNQLKLAAMMYEDASGSDYSPGPLTVDGDASTTPAMMAQYDHVWSVTREEIALHLAYHECLGDPDCDANAVFPDGYTIPQSILEWPAINTEPGFATYQAPFFDFDGDGDYTPASGDAPCILGDQALYFVFNDKGGPHVASGGAPIGVEIQAMAFAYTGNDPALEQTVFVHYHVINRGTQTLTGTRMGLFNDFDLGCADDDLVGTDPARNLAYVYNGDEEDGGCNGATGYGAQPPAFGMALLKGPYLDYDAMDNPVENTLPGWNGNAFGDQTVDNELFGITGSIHMYREGDACCTGPAEGMGMHFYNYLRGIWKDGTPLSYGGTGYNPGDPDALDCAFSLPGDSDPLGVGTEGVPQPAWTDAPSASADRRMLTSSGPFTLEPGMHNDLLVAYVYARAASGGALASLTALRARVDSVTAFAHTLPLYEISRDEFQGGCEGALPDGVGDGMDIGTLEVFPVPATDEVTLIAPATLRSGTIMLRDATGRALAMQRLVPGRNSIRIAGLANGVYFCDVIGTRTRGTARLLKQ